MSRTIRATPSIHRAIGKFSDREAKANSKQKLNKIRDLETRLMLKNRHN